MVFVTAYNPILYTYTDFRELRVKLGKKQHILLPYPTLI